MKKLTVTHDWRHLFKQQQRKSAQNFINKGNYRDFQCNGYQAKATIGQSRSTSFHPVISNPPSSANDGWEDSYFECDCSLASPKRTWYGEMKPGGMCSHEAALLMLWEKEHGPWTFTETQEEYEYRIEQEKIEKEKQRIKEWREREEAEEHKASEWKLSAWESNEPVYYDIPAALVSKKTSLYALNRASELLENKDVCLDGNPMLSYGDEGFQVLRCPSSTKSKYENHQTTVVIDGSKISDHKCSCRRAQRSYFGYYYESNMPLCPHELATLSLAWDYIKENNPGDATDKAAESFFNYLNGDASFTLEEKEENTELIEKEPVVGITPRLLIEGSTIKLTFRISKGGKKGMILKGFRNLQEAFEENGMFSLGKTLAIDFSKETFTEDSAGWVFYIFDKIGEADRVNDRIASTRFGYYGRGVAVQNAEVLRGSSLDQFYSLAQGKDVEYENKTLGKKGMIHIGDPDIKIRLECLPMYDSNKRVTGVKINGTLPPMTEGNYAVYAIGEKSVGPVDDEQWAAIKPFIDTWGWQEKLSFKVGKSRLPEFYYRVVPGLIDSKYIDFKDKAEAVAEKMLPPEPVFTFRMDMPGSSCVLDAQVAYGDAEPVAISEASEIETYHDSVQEERVLSAIGEYFSTYDEDKKLWFTGDDDNEVFLALTEGISKLSRFGDVLGTDALYSKQVRPALQISVNVGIEGGLLDIKVLSKDVSVDELKDLYHSYSLRKKYHRLGDGSFISLANRDMFAQIEALAGGMDLDAEEILGEEKQLPLFRALYLDHLLEEHEELAGSRSRTYRALIKGFRTIRDADYDVPEKMESILRQYQVYGHKWMRTVVETGFGGILADEMGLGKTLETISVMAAMKEEGSLGTSLVVCPASLVYNWQEEVNQFAPWLDIVPVAGNLSARKKLLAGENEPDIYVTSYDLLRKDINLYKDRQFTLMVIDEAQYIKNAKAAMTKAVKIIHAQKRIALTGTPIENRLAELWSIFDFLMPGFLYKYSEFSEKFEVPITKQKDEQATARLKQMVGPFILRRRKEDVLKDLPPKLEEVRYARFEEDQRKIYDAQVLRMKGMLTDSEGKGEDKIKMLAELMRIRQICCDPQLLFEDYKGESAKRAACIELVKNAIGGGHRMLIFSQFTSMLALLEEDLKQEKIPYYVITGATSKEKRIREVHAFNEGDVPVFLISLKAGGTGLNLTGADMVIHYDPWWNLAAQNQATDRAHRIGQENKVTVYKLIVKDTIEERIVQLQEAKKDLADAILSGEQKSLMSLTEEELMELL